MTLVDSVIIGVLVFYFWRGWSKGFFRSLLGPLTLAMALGYAFFYFQRTQNFLISIGICVLGPLVLSLALQAVYVLFKQAGHEPGRQQASHELQDRMLGGLVNMVWMGCMILLCLAMFVSIPLKMPFLEEARRAVLSSRIFDMVLAHRLPFLSKDFRPVDLEGDRAYMDTLQKSPEYQQLMNDPKTKTLFSDPQIQEKIENRDVAGLLSDPLVQEVMKDPQLIQKFLAVNQRMIEANQK